MIKYKPKKLLQTDGHRCGRPIANRDDVVVVAVLAWSLCLFFCFCIHVHVHVVVAAVVVAVAVVVVFLHHYGSDESFHMEDSNERSKFWRKKLKMSNEDSWNSFQTKFPC